MATIVLIRPGSTDYDEQSRLIGSLEMPMNDKGAEQVRTIVSELEHQGLQLEAVYAGPADPAASTARAIAESQGGVKLKKLDELGNVNQGLWQGLPESDIRKRYPKVFRNGREKPQSICPPEGETLGDACERMQKTLNKAIRKYSVFAIVVPDPIATVIRCTLENRLLEVSACLCGEQTSETIEIFESRGFDSGAFVNAEHCPESTVPVNSVDAVEGGTPQETTT